MKHCNCDHSCCEYIEDINLSPEEIYRRRLMYRKNGLRNINKYLSEARTDIWNKGGFKACKNSTEANLCIALEILEKYCRQQLNWELKDKGLLPLEKK